MTAEEFLKRYTELKLRVPRAALFNIKSENSEYTQYAIGNKNVYICFGSDENQDCSYGYWIYNNHDAIDSSFLYNSELCYECVDVRRSYNMSFCQDCSDCRDCFLCFDAIGASDCFGCVGVRRKQYGIFNEFFSKDEYEERVQALRAQWHTPQGEAALRRSFEALKQQVPHVYIHQLQAENCSGDHIFTSKNCEWSFDVRDCEDSQYCYNTFTLKNCSDCSYVKESELMYECTSAYGVNQNFCYVCWGGSNLDFCELCFNCSDCLGSIGLKNKRFHILNEAYPEAEYRKLAAEIQQELRKAGWYGGRLPSVYWES